MEAQTFPSSRNLRCCACHSDALPQPGELDHQDSIVLLGNSLLLGLLLLLHVLPFLLLGLLLLQ